MPKARLDAESHFAPYVLESPAIAHAGGALSKYDPSFCQRVIDLAALGHTLGGTAALIGVSRSTLLDWAASKPEFGDAIARAKEVRLQRRPSHRHSPPRWRQHPLRCGQVRADQLRRRGLEAEASSRPQRRILARGACRRKPQARPGSNDRRAVVKRSRPHTGGGRADRTPPPSIPIAARPIGRVRWDGAAITRRAVYNPPNPVPEFLQPENGVMGLGKFCAEILEESPTADLSRHSSASTARSLSGGTMMMTTNRTFRVASESRGGTWAATGVSFHGMGTPLRG